MTLSIIIPAYNTEIYIQECLESCLTQDIAIQEYEIIIVNDGSTDGTLSIIKEYAEKYPNIYIINQRNQGVSVAKNAGLLQARGEYIMFVDSDDFITKNSLSTYIKQAYEQDLDLLLSDYELIKLNGKTTKETNFRKIPLPQKIYSGTDILERYYGYHGFMCMGLYRRSLFIDNALFFQPGIIFEDLNLVFRIILKAERIMYYPHIIYHYVKHESSLTSVWNLQKANMWFQVVANLKALSNSSLSKGTKHFFERNYSFHLYRSLRKTTKNFPADFNIIIEIINEEGLLPIMLSGPLKQRIESAIFNASPHAFFNLLQIKEKVKSFFSVNFSHRKNIRD